MRIHRGRPSGAESACIARSGIRRTLSREAWDGRTDWLAALGEPDGDPALSAAGETMWFTDVVRTRRTRGRTRRPIR
ncbi:hypothetical protein GCM10023169_17120 [Georgenia halophila]|uniref:Uncharacterized protein n=1 Tax=Georgenia halophila TaxID=620889 RepID=A0ABP8L5C0_9MICO